MEHLWIALAVLAALLQAVRTAAQRDLNKRLSTLATTYVRSLFGLPVMVLYLIVVLAMTGEGMPRLNAAYLLFTLAGAMAQVIATMLLIRMFTLRNFGVGTMLTKVDIVITAILGAVLFSETLTAGGVLALAVVMAGVVLMSIDRTLKVAPKDAGANHADSTSRNAWRAASNFACDPALRVAFGCAFSFSISYLTLREATLVMGDGGFAWRGAWTVVISTAMQTVIVGAYIAWKEPAIFGQMLPNARLSSFIGAASAVGSICWFTAFALQNASYVRAVGQVEVVFTLLVAALYYRERITAAEYAGIALTIAGVLLFRLMA